MKNNEVKNRIFGTAEQRTAALVKAMFQRLNVVDGWAAASKKAFTWTSSRTGEQAFSTLDRILFTNDGFSMENMKVDWALCVSDHAAVIATFLSKNASKKSTLISRLDSRLLQDREGTEKLDDVFQELFSQRLPEWNPHVSLEYTKMCIRTAANDANGKLKAKMRDSEKILNNDINYNLENNKDKE